VTQPASSLCAKASAVLRNINKITKQQLQPTRTTLRESYHLTEVIKHMKKSCIEMLYRICWLTITDGVLYLNRFLRTSSCSVNGALYPNLMSVELPGLGEVTTKAHLITLYIIYIQTL